MDSGTSQYDWQFINMGGVEQVVLSRGGDLCHLRDLDPKLWAAMSCPASGMEFDQRTLALVDTDKDGRIRVPEIIEAVEWTCARLKDPAALIDPAATFDLSLIDGSTDDGKKILSTAQAILVNLGKQGASSLTQDDVIQSRAHANEMMFNGDGILPPLANLDPDIQAYINDALAVMGGLEDASGRIGIDKAISQAFVTSLNAWRSWRKSVDQTSSPLGKDTPEAWALLSELKDKINDYFLRCEMAAFAPQTVGTLNFDDKLAAPGDQGILDMTALAALPLSRIEADKPLHLLDSVNPAWRDKTERFAHIFAPLLGNSSELDEKTWKSIQENFTTYAAALESKPAPAAAAVTAPPTSSIDSLGENRITAILDSDVATCFDELSDQDRDLPAAASDISAVERLALYYFHLHRLLTNFVSFEEFYSLTKKAAFQAGTLYIDSRSCKLCLTASEVEKHSLLAARSRLFLLYCSCSRGKKPDSAEPLQTMNIAAAVTAGDADLLMEGRRGVFIDNNGDDWDATVVKIVSNPIGLAEAVWTPYKRFGAMLTDWINKFASDKQAGIMDAAGKKLEQLGSGAKADTPPPPFDIGKNVGIFAAIGLAVGAIGTAIAGIAHTIFAMEWWQLPILFFGIFLIISGPSVILAFLKLRQRTIGPLLEASGWAVNSRIVINYALSRLLTSTAVLPEGCSSSGSVLSSLSKRRRHRRLRAFLLAVIVGVLLVLGFLLLKKQVQNADFMKEPVPAAAPGEPAADQAAAPASEPPKPAEAKAKPGS